MTYYAAHRTDGRFVGIFTTPDDARKAINAYDPEEFRNPWEHVTSEDGERWQRYGPRYEYPATVIPCEPDTHVNPDVYPVGF